MASGSDAAPAADATALIGNVRALDGLPMGPESAAAAVTSAGAAAPASAGVAAAATAGIAELLAPIGDADLLELPSGLSQRDKLSWYIAERDDLLEGRFAIKARLTDCQSALRLRRAPGSALPASLPVPPILPTASAPVPALVSAPAPAFAALHLSRQLPRRFRTLFALQHPCLLMLRCRQNLQYCVRLTLP